ncbi:MAG: ABC transporter substrate-binding protein [Planctomycetota bacterium]|nr:ABC transporter substrate-binding protein [Planctomycetota bacterium]
MRSFILVSLLLLAPAAIAGPNTPPSGTVRFALTGEINTLDPVLASTEAERVCVSNLYDQLYEHAHHPRPFRLKPALAADFPEVSEDGLTQTIQLRKGVHFVDDACFEGSRGREVTAQDVVFCLKRLMDANVASPYTWMFERKIKGLDRFAASSKKPSKNPTRSAYRTTEGYTEVAGLEVVDDHTLRIHLLEPTPELPWMLASNWCSIYARESVRRYGANLGRHAVGTGPYRLLIFEGKEKLTLRHNPRYRREESVPALEGGTTHSLPRNDTVIVRAYKDPRAAWAALLADEADCAAIARDAFTTAVDVRTGRLLPHLVERGMTLHRDERLEIHYDAFNMQDPVLGHPAGEKGRALRTAICLATDDVYALTRLYTYGAERVFGPILPDLAGYKRGFVNPALPGERETHEEALAVAKEVLEEAGVDDTSRVPVLKMHITPDVGSRNAFAIFKKQLAELGLRIEAIAKPWKELQKDVTAGKAQMWSSSWHGDYPDAQNFLMCFYSRSPPSVNACRYSNSEFDEVYEEMRGVGPGQEREELLRELQDIVVQDAVWRYKFRRINWKVTQKSLEGYRFNGIAPKHFKHCAVKVSK